MMRKIILLLIIVVALTQSATAQVAQKSSTTAVSQKAAKTTVKGVLIDGATGGRMIGAVVIVQGTTVGGISDDKGNFSIKGVEKGKDVKIEISFVGYATQLLTVNTKNDVYEFKTPITMQVDGVKIKDVNVMGSAAVAKIKGDTTVFNAGAYKINPDATAGDLLAKMPGFEKNDDGTVSQQGDKVQRVYVDGKSFFKNDLATALNALSADMVEGVEMFDDKSDRAKFTGFDDGTNIKSINIITKNRQGTKPTGMVEASVGYGYEDVYMGSLNMTRMSGDRQISLMAGSNNVNISPIQQRRGFGRGGSGGGINTQTGVALNFTNSFKNDGEVSASYTYNRGEKERVSYQNRTYFPSKDYTNYIYQTNDSSINISNSHNFSVDLQSTILEKTRVTFRPTGSITYSDNFSRSYNSSMMDGDTTRNNRINTSTPDGYNIGGELSIMRKINEKSFMTLGINGSMQKNNSDSYLVGETIYDKLTAESDSTFQHQMSDNRSNTNEVGVNLDYTRRITGTSALNFGYEFGYNVSDNDKRTYLWDEMEGRYVDLDSTLSNNFQRNYMTNGAGVSYNYKTETTTFNLGAKYQNASLQNNKIFPTPAYKRDYSFNGAVINSDFVFKKSKEGGSLTLRYRGRPSYPSVTQLQDVLNNDNPLQLSSGNPDLKQSFNNSVELRYRGASMKKSMFWSVFSSISNTINGVVNNTVLFQEDGVIDIGGVEYEVRQGAQYTSQTNMNGTWNARLGGMFSFPAGEKLKLNIMGSYGFVNRPSMYNNVKYSSQENSFSLNVGFNSNISSNIDFSVNNNVNYKLSASNRVDDNTSFSNNLRANVNWIIWKGFFLNVDYNMNYQKLSNTPLEKPFRNMLNGAIGKKFYGDRFEVRASIYDALNQNVNIEQTVSDIYLAETISNNLTRYVSVSLTYKFSSIKKSQREMRGPGGYGGGHGGGRRTM